MAKRRYREADVNHVRTNVVQTGESSTLMRHNGRFDHGFPQSFPQIL
jgi:hypothetical protein